MTITITKVIQTCYGCPSQWDAWTSTGQYLYLRYRWGQGTVDAYPSDDYDAWTEVPTGRVATFSEGDSYAGIISLEDFLAAAGMRLAPGAEVS